MSLSWGSWPSPPHSVVQLTQGGPRPFRVMAGEAGGRRREGCSVNKGQSSPSHHSGSHRRNGEQGGHLRRQPGDHSLPHPASFPGAGHRSGRRLRALESECPCSDETPAWISSEMPLRGRGREKQRISWMRGKNLAEFLGAQCAGPENAGTRGLLCPVQGRAGPATLLP